jgi:hypothetical protein
MRSAVSIAKGKALGRNVMTTQFLDSVSTGCGPWNAHEKQGNLLAASTNELASLRFSIILTARWEAAAFQDLERRNELRAELADLRCQYSQKVDYLAMTFGIQSAMDVKEEVERNVVVPLGMELDFSIMQGEDDGLCF